MKIKKILKILISLFIFFSIIVILLNAFTQLYEDREKILRKLGILTKEAAENISLLTNTNPLFISKKQVPPKNYQELELIGNENEFGAWTAPFDWNVTAIHSVLLPDETVMTFGSYAVKEKENNKDIRENKKLVLTDDFQLERDKGDLQWIHHDVQGGVDFDIWDPEKGVGEDSHTVYHKPLVLDAFCAVIRVLDLENVFILGGNKEPKDTGPDTQNATTFFNIKSKKFIEGNKLNFKRWYGSIVRTADDKFIMLGGADITREDAYSIVPEILEKESFGNYNWKLLENAESNSFFGQENADEWNYPKSFLASDGNIFGISYNKLWVIEPKEDFKISKVGEIPLVTGGIKRKLQDVNLNNNEIDDLKLFNNWLSGWKYRISYHD